MNPKHSFKVLLAAALGVLAILVLPGLASAKDRNHDHIPDRWEVRHKLSLKVNQARKDQDHDHMRNLAEFKAGDNPRNSDSDNDGVMDGEENAGTIASFDAATGKLVITLFGGETITGLVTEQTEIQCDGVDDNGGEASTSSDESESESGDDHGDNGEGAGDDNGGQGDEPNGDNGDNSGSNGQDDNGGEGGNCTTADLIKGAVVQEAELQLENGTATFEKVELAHTTS